ncbi:MAG: hypothetical protein L0154_04815 [Chloroflexi bacterium]|nr:hypothetical protein [Chloroflexota bacterium]
MDIQHLVDRLEDLIDEGRHVPLSKYTMVDEERALEIIDQMRISIPEQIEKATRIVNQRDRLIAQANEEATRMVELARKKGEEMVERDSIVQTARHRADNIIRQAHQEADQVRDEADTYVMQVLKELEGQLLRTLTIVRNGITKITQERETRQQQQYQQAQMQYQQPVQQMQPPHQPQALPQLAPVETQIEQHELVDADTGE